jgi:hypothetical protein
MLVGHGGNICAAARQFGRQPSELIDISLKTPEANMMVAEKLIALMTINKPIREEKRVA